MTSPQELKAIVSEGLLSFPVTDFDEQGDFRADTYAARLEWLAPYGATALFAAGGTGEFFSLTRSDYTKVVRTATETCRGKVPILAGAGGPTRVAIEYAKEAERLGASGVLLMPHYLTEASQEGIAAHVEQVCKAVKNIGVIVYNRANSKLNADMLERIDAEVRRARVADPHHGHLGAGRGGHGVRLERYVLLCIALSARDR